MAKQTEVLGSYVLVKQNMTAKGGRIILDKAEKNEDKFDYTFEVVQLGKDCKSDIKVGDNPVFSEHVRFQGLKVLEKTDRSMTSLIIVHEGDIIAREWEYDDSVKTDDIVES